MMKKYIATGNFAGLDGVVINKGDILTLGGDRYYKDSKEVCHVSSQNGRELVEEAVIKDFNVTIAYEDGLFAHINNYKAINRAEALKKLVTEEFRDVENIVTITILPKVEYND